MRHNTAVIILALVLMMGGFVGVLFIGQIVNPPTVAVAVAAVDIPAGTILREDMVAIDSVRMNPKVIGVLVSESELKQFIGSTVVEPIYVYQPLRKSAISAEGNPASAKRLALGLADPNLVAMVVPVSAETAPDAIVEGDYVDLNFGVGGNTQFGEKLTTESTPSPFTNGFAGSFPNSFASPQPLLPFEATAATTPTPTQEPLLVLPVAKTIVSNAKVLAVIRDERTETVQDQRGVKTVRVPDKIIAIVVAIPREAQELIQFAIDNGTVRVALLSAQLDSTNPGERRPTLGMTWNDLVAVVRMERDEVLAQGLPTQVIGPGAYAIEATRSAATEAAISTSTAVVSTPVPRVTPTPATQTPATATHNP
jgi:hypothetical protein